jgi:hypothetical protein
MSREIDFDETGLYETDDDAGEQDRSFVSAAVASGLTGYRAADLNSRLVGRVGMDADNGKLSFNRADLLKLPETQARLREGTKEADQFERSRERSQRQRGSASLGRVASARNYFSASDDRNRTLFSSDRSERLRTPLEQKLGEARQALGKSFEGEQKPPESFERPIYTPKAGNEWLSREDCRAVLNDLGVPDRAVKGRLANVEIRAKGGSVEYKATDFLKAVEPLAQARKVREALRGSRGRG